MYPTIPFGREAMQDDTLEVGMIVEAFGGEYSVGFGRVILIDDIAEIPSVKVEMFDSRLIRTFLAESLQRRSYSRSKMAAILRQLTRQIS